MRVYLDIETTHSIDPEVHREIAETVSPPSNYTKPETIAKWHEEKGADVIAKEIAATALDGAYGELTTIGWAIDDGPINIAIRDIFDDERLLFNRLGAELGKAIKPQDYPLTFIGHNLDFDLRFIWKRAIILGIRMPEAIPRRWKLWEPSIFDIQFEWTGQPREYIKQTKIAKLLGIKVTDEIDGKQCPQLWRDGLVGEVAAHCSQDIRVCREIHQRMMVAGK